MKSLFLTILAVFTLTFTSCDKNDDVVQPTTTVQTVQNVPQSTVLTGTAWKLYEISFNETSYTPDSVVYDFYSINTMAINGDSSFIYYVDALQKLVIKDGLNLNVKLKKPLLLITTNKLMLGGCDSTYTFIPQ